MMKLTNALNCFEKQQMPIIFGNNIENFQFTAVDQDGDDFVFGGDDGTYPSVGYYQNQDDFHIIKWHYSYDTQGLTNTVKTISFRNKVIFVTFIGGETHEVYATLNQVDGTVLASKKFGTSFRYTFKSSAIDQYGDIYVCGNIPPALNEVSNQVYGVGNYYVSSGTLTYPFIYTINFDLSSLFGIRLVLDSLSSLSALDAEFQIADVEKTGTYLAICLTKQGSGLSNSYFGFHLESGGNYKSFVNDDVSTVSYDCQGLSARSTKVAMILQRSQNGVSDKRVIYLNQPYLDFTVSHAQATVDQYLLVESLTNAYQINAYPSYLNAFYIVGSIMVGANQKAVFTKLADTVPSQICQTVYNQGLVVLSALTMNNVFSQSNFYLQEASSYSLNGQFTISIKSDMRTFQSELQTQTCYKPTGYRKVKATAGQANNTSTVVTDIQDFTLILGHYTLDDCPDFTGTFEIKIVEGGNPTIERFAQNYSGQYFADFSVTQDDLRPALTLGIQYTLKVQVDFKIGEFLYDRNDEILFNVKIEDCGLYFDETSRPYIPDMNYAINSSTTTSNLVGLTYEPTGCGTIQYLPSLVDEISISSNKINAIYEKPQFETQLQRKQVEVNETLNYQLPSILNPDKILYSVKLMSGSASSFTQIIQLSNKYVFLANPYEVQQVGTHQITIRIKEKLNSQKYIEYNFQLTVVNSNINFYEIEKLKNETIFMQEAGKNRTGYVQARIRQVTNNDLASIGEAMAASIKWTLSTVFGTNIFINILISQSAQYLWGMIEGFQYITHLPLMSVVLPSNTLIYFQFINDIASFNLVDTDGARRLNWRYFRIDIEHNNCNYPTTVSPSIAVPGSTYSKHMHREVLQHEVRFTLRKHPLPKTSGNKSLRQDIYKTKLKRYFENFKCSNDNSKKNSLLVITDDAIPVLYVHKFGLHILRWSLQNFKILQAKKSQEDELVTIFLNIGIRQQSSIESQNVKERQIQE
eukprot:403369249